AVENPLRMSGRQAPRQLNAEPQHLLLRQRAFLQALVERNAWDVFHDQVIDSLLGVEVVHRLDVGVVEATEDKGLAAETLARGGVAQSLGIEYFDCNISLQSLIARTVNDAKAAHTDFFDEAKMAEGLPGRGGRRRHTGNLTRAWPRVIPARGPDSWPAIRRRWYLPPGAPFPACRVE